MTRTGIALLAAALVPAASHAAQRPLLRDFIGINGHTVQFKPDLYQPICRLVRDYHPVAWDLAGDTSSPPPFPLARNKVNWEHVYGSWRKHGWTINACLMFESVKRGDWKNLEQDAQAYGEAFARGFGPSGSRQLVESVEIGNEPGSWSDDDYSRIHKAMAEGLRKGDPRLKIATCNLTTGPSGKYEKSVSCIAAMPELVDVLTIHSYAQLEGWPTWKRSFPEDPALRRYIQDISDLCAWRDSQMPGKPVWVTEFGYDSTTAPQEKSGDFAKWTGVTDTQQAQWIVRSLLVFSAMPVERAYIYFFNDDNKASVHASSGLTRHFTPKPSYFAMRHLQQTLGGFRFHRCVTDDPGKLRVHEYIEDGAPHRLAWAVWVPHDPQQAARVTLENVPGRLLASTRMPLADGPAPDGGARQYVPGQVELDADGSPVYLILASDAEIHAHPD